MPEPQYRAHIDLAQSHGLTRLGLRANAYYENDPRGLLFNLARYKHTAKLLSGKAQVLEVGCGDCFCARLVQQEVGHLTAVDFDPAFIRDAIDRQSDRWPLDVFVHDILRGPVTTWHGEKFDAAYTLDVIEHIRPEDEALFMKNVVASLGPHGVLVLGTPSKESQAYASEGSKLGHVNLFDAARLAKLMGEYFYHVFSFGLQDETLTTGFEQMRHYLIALGVEQKG